MYLRRILTAVPIFALVHVVACSDQENDAFPKVPPNALAAEDGGAPTGMTTPATLTSKKLCSVTKAGDAGKVIAGKLLLPDAPIDGELFIDAAGAIQCAAKSCSGTDGYATASKIACTNAVVSPGLINPHDHIPFAATPPQKHGAERFEQRNDWREGLRGHAKISASSKGAPNATDAAELRFAMSGVTAAASAGGVKGLIRNVDSAGMLEAGLVMNIANSDTFPLDDGSLMTAPTTCSDWSGPKRTTAAKIAALDGYLPHISEGINLSAHAEFTCLSTDPTFDLVQRQTAVIHGVAVGPADAALYRTRQSILVWSPRSNVDLYGNTAPVALYAHAGVPIALGTDWLPSGSMNMSRELKCADDLNTRYFGKALTDKQLWEAVTINAAYAVGAQGQLGSLRKGYVGDVAIFDATGKEPYRAVIEAGVEDTVLVLRAGQALYGDSELVKSEGSGGGADCEALTVCNYTKMACVKKDLVKKSLADLQTAADSVYPLFFCKDQAVKDEPSCTPTRGPTDGQAAVSAYTGITATDKDGDGVADDADDCPAVFNPIRPMDNGVQADADGDGIGDACDKCPLASGEGCTPPDADDMDGDGVVTWLDNCPEVANPDQTDADGDGKGAACDKDGLGGDCDGTANPGVGLCPQAYSIDQLRRAGDPAHPASGKTRAIVSGVWVTAVKTIGSGTQGFFIQSGTAQYSGMFVAQNAPTVVVGNRIDVTGDYTEASGLSQLSNVVVDVVDPTTALPFGPVTVDPDIIGDSGNAYARGEPWESMLVHVNGPIAISIVNPDDDGTTPTPDHDEFAVGTANLRVDDYLDDPLENTDPIGTTFTKIDGICGFSFGARKIWPRTDADIVKQ